MNPQNHTPIVPAQLHPPKAPVTSTPKEAEPLRSREEPIVSDQGERAEDAQQVEEPVEEESTQAGTYSSMLPDEPILPEELQKAGVQEVDQHTKTFIFNNKQVTLPLAIDEVEEGRHRPITSGMRWLAVITEYILAHFHKVIKRVAGVLQIVDKE